MEKKHSFQLFWEARRLSVSDYARELAQLLDVLRDAHPTLAIWYAEGSDLVLRGPRTDEAALCAYLNSQPEYWKHGSTEYSAVLGAFDNRRSARNSAQLSIRCGLTQPSTTVWFANYLSVRFWPSGPDGPWPLERTDAVFRIACQIFRPRWACLGPLGFPKRPLDEDYAGVPLVSSRLYLAPSYPAPVALAPPSSVQRFEDGSTIVRSVSGWLNPESEADRAACERTRAALDLKGCC